jgi:hypothetical protein
MEAPARLAAIEQILSSLQWTPAEVERRLAWCIDPAYWTGRLPGASIGGPASRHDEAVAPPSDTPASAADVLVDGYCVLPVFLSPDGIRGLNAAIDVVTAHGWPPTFAWVFDELWRAARAASIRHLITATLGDAAQQIPHVWVHVVSAHGGKGWSPHVDGGEDRDARARLTVWIALTDAGVDGGCMYVVPRTDAPADLGTFDWSKESLRQADALRMIGAVRALPADAGSALAWNFDVLHWGSACCHAGGARRSLSIEFIARGSTPTPDEVPLLNCGERDPLPTLDERLRCIAWSLLEYNQREPAMRRFAPLAEALLSRSV